MRIIGLMVCGAGEADRYLRKTLEEFKRLCDGAMIATCNATEKEKQMIAEYGFDQYEDNREWGKFQPDIKTDLLKRIGEKNPDWIVALDADETLPTVDRAELERLTVGRESCMFYVVNLWNDITHYSKGLGFWNVRFFKYLPERGQQYLRKPLHCGLAPPYFYALPAKETHVPHQMVHYGLMKESDRMRKVSRYRQYDPDAIYKGRQYYDALAARGGGSLYSMADVQTKITEFCSKL